MFSGRGDTVFTGGEKGKIYEYNVEDGELKSDVRKGDDFISSLASSGKGHFAAGNAIGDLYIADEEGNYAAVLTEHKKFLRALAFTPDSSKILIASDDLRISVYDL